MIDSRSRIALAALLLLAFGVGCVRTELNRAKQARADYQACLAEHPRRPELCNELRDAMNQAYDGYENASADRSRAWRDERPVPD